MTCSNNTSSLMTTGSCRKDYLISTITFQCGMEMNRKDIVTGFMLVAVLGIIASAIMSFVAAGIGTPDEVFFWQQAVTLFIALYFASMIPSLLNERRKENGF